MAEETRTPGGARADLPARVLEIGLAAVIVLAPLPSGSVREPARSALEAVALALAILWLLRAATRPARLPPRLAQAGIAGLLLLGVVQAMPLGAGLVGALSPRAAAIRSESRPDALALEGERLLLGSDPGRSDRVAAISVDPPATASALRTGAALAALLLVALAVVSERGAAGIAIALLVSAAFQGLYGTLLVAARAAAETGAGTWLASGTFVNKNHYAGFLAASLPAGIALVLAHLKRLRERDLRLARFLGGEGSRALLLGLLAVVGLTGLLLSFSRAGIALGALGVVLTFAAAGRRGLKTSLAAAIALLAVAAVPLAQLGAERLATSYGRVPLEFGAGASRGTVWRDTLAMAASFPAAGTGFGTFSAAYPLFRSPEVRTLWVHAHNDPLQALSEGGVPAILLLALLLVPLLIAARGALSGRAGPLAAGFAAGLLVLLLHSLVDFNFHIPSNAALAAILAGALLGSELGAGSREMKRGSDPAASLEDENRGTAPDSPGGRNLVPAPGLRLVEARPAAADGRSRALLFGSLPLLAAVAATTLSARAAREPLDAWGLAGGAVAAAIDSGPGAGQVRAAVKTLREEIGRRPLDAAARAAYAGLLLELSASPAERRAAAFHAARAAELAPVTVPVVETSARVLARSGEARRAVELLRRMFGYDPSSAADLYLAIEPFVSAKEMEGALPADPDAWVAWIGRLRAAGRSSEAEARLDRAGVLWPKHPRVRALAAFRALGAEGWNDLRRILPPDEDLPREPETAALFACRARLRAATGDPPGARADAAEAVRLAPRDAWIRLQAGIATEASGNAAGARAQWERGLFEIVPAEGNRWLRKEIFARLARLEDRVGRPADALRAWRSVLDLSPSDAEARRRVEELSGP